MKIKLISEQEAIKKCGDLNGLPEGVFGREWDVISYAFPYGDERKVYSIQSALLIPDIFVKEEIKENYSSFPRITKEEDGVKLLSANGVITHMTWADFWAVCRFGTKIDLENEVTEYIQQLDKDTVCRDVPLADILENYSVDDICTELADYRASNENGDQIYEVLRCFGVKLARKLSIKASSEA